MIVLFFFLQTIVNHFDSSMQFVVQLTDVIAKTLPEMHIKDLC